MRASIASAPSTPGVPFAPPPPSEPLVPGDPSLQPAAQLQCASRPLKPLCPFIPFSPEVPWPPVAPTTIMSAVDCPRDTASAISAVVTCVFIVNLPDPSFGPIADFPLLADQRIDVHIS